MILTNKNRFHSSNETFCVEIPTIEINLSRRQFGDFLWAVELSVRQFGDFLRAVKLSVRQFSRPKDATKKLEYKTKFVFHYLPLQSSSFSHKSNFARRGACCMNKYGRNMRSVPSGGIEPPTCHWTVVVLPLN